jgi:hypothetical protein
VPGAQRDAGLDDLAAPFVGDADDGAFGDGFLPEQHVFHFRGGDPHAVGLAP